MYNDASNGFQNIVIPMSTNHQSIMHSILAVAAFDRRRKDAFYGVVALKQKENALLHVRSKVLANSAQDYDESIVLAIMLCVFEIKDGSGEDWAKHLHRGRAILHSQVQKKGSQLWAGGIAWWANKFFGYLAVNSASGKEPEASEIFETHELWLSKGFEVEVGEFACYKQNFSDWKLLGYRRIHGLLERSYGYYCSSLQPCQGEI